MRLQSSFECLFHTLPDGRRVFYPRMWRGPGVQLRDPGQEAALRHELRANLWILRFLMLLIFLLILAPSALHSAPLLHMAQPALTALGTLILGALIVFSVVVMQWRRDHLVKDCPGIAERLTQRDFETCLAMRLSVGGLKLRVFVLVLLGGASLGRRTRAARRQRLGAGRRTHRRGGLAGGLTRRSRA